MTHNRYGPPRQAAPKLIPRLGGTRLAIAVTPATEGPDSAPDVLSSGAGVSDKPSLAYLKDHVVRLAGGIACPNCNHPLRAIDTIIDFDDVGHAALLELPRRHPARPEPGLAASARNTTKAQVLINQTMENQNVRSL
jgi:hypothetical protein